MSPGSAPWRRRAERAKMAAEPGPGPGPDPELEELLESEGGPGPRGAPG